MFEDRTAENILAEMLEDVDNSLDKREGSMIYNALAPVAQELSAAYADLGTVVDEMFADTASLPNLKKIAAERGVNYLEAERSLIAAEIKPADGEELSFGDRFFIGDVFFVWNGMKSDDGSVYLLECETEGSEGNISSGSLIYNGGSAVESAKILNIVVFGRDSETRDELKNRYDDSLESMPFGGNPVDYKERTLSNIGNIGGVQVRRAWNGGGTVKLVVIGEDYGIPDEKIVNDVQNLWDPIVEGQRTGEGLAPIDHEVTVVAVGQESVDIQTVIEFESGYTWENVKDAAFSALSEYFQSVCMDWADNGSATIRIGRIESVLSTVEGIIEASETTLNGNTKNLTFDGDNIPTVGNIEVSSDAP